MKEPVGDFFVFDGALHPVSEFNDDMINTGLSVYEVIRLHRGIPYFFDEHFERLENSASIEKMPVLMSKNQLLKDISSLPGMPLDGDINVKVVLNYGKPGHHYFAYFIKSVYPSVNHYDNGVHAVLFPAERSDPGAKVLNSDLRASVNSALQSKNAWEALLVDKEGFITEGSRSNVFFLNGNRLLTAPDSRVLGGITRRVIIELCHENNIGLDFGMVKAGELSRYNSAFISGTSPGVLPLSKVENVVYDPQHPLVKKLRLLYEARAEMSLKAINC